MEGKMADEEKEKGFAVRDKRVFPGGKAEERKEETADRRRPTEEHGEPGEAQQPGERPEKEEERKESEGGEEAPLPEINFSTFIFSLSTSALIQLGEMPDPVTKESGKNLPLAKQTIDIMGMLQEKTQGNLTSDEETLVKNILYDLRMRFVKARS